jgi:TonB-linked SusC/RagA family outer membrane protein
MRKLASLLSVLMLLCTLAHAQTRTVTGVIKDEKGDPIPFATIQETGTKNATQADANGLFSIKIAANSKLTITATGHEPQTITPSMNAVAVTLPTTNSEMTEVVVTTALGVKKQQRQVGYSTTQVNAKELTAGKATNIGSALSGKVAGLLIQQPNSSVTNDVRVTLRGNRSLLGNNQPILVVDGSIISLNYLNQISPNDVDNVNVLKGATATALYGNEASNGAIIITTKKGSRSRPVVNLSSSLNMESISLMPELQNEFGSYGGEGLDPQGRSSYIPYENQSYGPRYDGSIVPLGAPVRITRPDGTTYDTTWMVPYKALPDEKRKFFDKALTFQNMVSFSTGDASSQLYVSFENMRKNGTIPKDYASRNSARLNASKDFNKVTVGANFNYIQSIYDVVGPDVQQGRNLYWSVLNTPAHVPLTKLSDTYTNPFAMPTGYFNAYYGNPWWAINNSRQHDIRDNIISNLKVEIRPLTWLSASYTVNYNAYFDRYQYHRNSQHLEEWGKFYADNGFDIYPASGGYKSTNYPVGYAQTGYKENYNYSRVQGDFLLSMRHHINKFSGTLLLGQSTIEIKTNRGDIGYDPNSGAVNTYDDLAVWGPAYAIGTPLSYTYITKQRGIGVFGDVSLGYSNFLFLHGSLRNDWDSRLEQDNRSFLYPEADASFVFTDAISALKNFKILNAGKIRFSYAKVGQVNIGPYSTRDYYVTPASLGFPYTSAAGTISSYSVGGTFNNPNIKPEFTVEKEIGLELAWLKNRLLTDFAVFKENTTNETLQLGISPAAGRGSAYLNIGELQNKGFEADIKGTIIQKKDLRWQVGVTYSYIENKVISIAPGTESQLLTGSGLGGGVYAIVGKAYPYLQTTDWVRDSASGKIIVDASSGLPTKNPNVTPYGTTQPPHRLGINTTLSWKHFTFYALAEYRGGAVILNDVASSLDFTGVSTNTTKFNREKFVIPNSVYWDGSKYVNNTTVVTNTDAWNFFGNLYNGTGSNYVTSADFWKLREVSIGYDIPQNITAKTKVIKAANIALYGRDLVILKAKDDIWTDPEFSNTTGNGVGVTTTGQTPSTRKYGITLNLTF